MSEVALKQIYYSIIYNSKFRIIYGVARKRKYKNALYRKTE